MPLSSVNPATGETIATYPDTTPAGIERALQAADRAYRQWRRRPVRDRTGPLREAARILRERRQEHARTMALEMGKPIGQGEAESEKCAWVCEFYADHAEEFLAPLERKTDAAESFVRLDPIGPVLAVMPWNYPFWQVFRFAVPALAAGNAALLKHASNVPGCALAIEATFREAGLPDGLFQSLLVGSGAVAPLVADPRVAAVTLTGSDLAGSRVGSEAGRNLKKSVLELGGSDPFIVLEDADVARAASVAAEARLLNSGQSCIAAKRFIVVESVAERFIEGLVAEMSSRTMGDPLERSTQVGPQARVDLRDALDAQVIASVRKGASVVLGGRTPGGDGAYYPPTVLTGVVRGMPAFDEETFGPVAAVARARDEAEAIRIANDSLFGLGASLWTADRGRARRLAAEIEAGCVFVNDLVKSDPRLPFGGVKRSGYGRELSEFGIREFVNVKSVSVA